MARQRKQGNPILSAIIFAVIGIIFLFYGTERTDIHKWKFT